MAPRARSTPAVSTAMLSALDALSSVLVAEHPRREARRLDRVVGAERGPVDVAAGIRRAAAGSRCPPKEYGSGARHPAPPGRAPPEPGLPRLIPRAPARWAAAGRRCRTRTTVW